MLPMIGQHHKMVLRLFGPQELERRLRRHLLQGQLPDAYLYIGRGAENWLALDHSSGFRVASGLTELLRKHAARIVKHLPKKVELLSIGVGEGCKERILLEAMSPGQCRNYIAIDVSEPLVEAALETVASIDVPRLGVVAFAEDLPRLRPYRRRPTLLCLLGNNFSNYQPSDLLAMLSKEIGSRDLLLFDCHLCPGRTENSQRWRRSVQEVYRQEQNVGFNLAPLVARGVHQEDCRFSLNLLRVLGRQGPVYRTFKQIQILRDCTAMVGNQPVVLHASQAIQMGFTYKHTVKQVVAHVGESGLGIVWKAVSSDGENGVFLCRKMQRK